MLDFSSSAMQVIPQGLNEVLKARQYTPTQQLSDGCACSNPTAKACKPADRLLCDLSNPFGQTLNANAFFIAAGTSIGAMVLITMLFSLLRPHNSVVYAPKLRHADDKHAPPPIGKGLFAWFTPVLRTSEQQLVDKVGLDATLFLRFTRMCRNMFLVLSIFGCGILIPTHIIKAHHEQTKGLTGDGYTKAFELMTPQYASGTPMWSHVVCSWIFDIVIALFLWRNYRAVTRLRRQYFESPEYQMSLHARTLWVADIAPSQRSDEGITQILNQVDQASYTPRAAIGRNVKELPELIEEHNHTVRALESILAKYLKNPDRLPAKRPTLRASKKDRRNKQHHRVDAIDYLTGRINELEAEIKNVRHSVDKRHAMPYGFASYEQIEQAHTMAFNARKQHPDKATVLLAPKPNDLIWENLSLSQQARRRKRFMISLWIVILTVVWIAPNTMIAIFLSNFGNLAALWDAFNKSYHDHPKTWAALQGVAAPGLTSLIYLLLPIMFRRMSVRAGDTTKTSREHHVTHKLYAFFVFNNLIVFSVFSALWAFVANVIQAKDSKTSIWDAINGSGSHEGQGLAHRIMIALCLVSPFWVNWLLTRNLGSAADLAQMITLVWTWFARTFMSPTPRQAIEWTAPPAFDYASYYNYFLFYATVSLCYATLQPLVLLVTALYFVVDSWLKKYLLLYVFVTKTESGGQFWRTLFNRLLFATILANCVATLVLKTNLGTWTMVGCMAPLPILLLGFKWYCSKTFDDQSRYYIMAAIQDAERLAGQASKSRGNDRVHVRFGNPALYSKLITPMVHAKAQEALAQIYRGRLASDGAAAAEYSDIVMDDMSSTRPGKNARFAPDADKKREKGMFEIVPESNLDFAYFKNRAEFREEHGGDGELYGRPQDLVGERSHTPVSFMSGDEESNPSSRDPSPPVRNRRLDELAYNPAYRDQPGHGGGDVPMYATKNESESTLLGSAQPLGHSEPVGPPQIDGAGDQYGLDRWRTGRAGYLGVPTAPQGEEPLGYDAYRRGP